MNRLSLNFELCFWGKRGEWKRERRNHNN